MRPTITFPIPLLVAVLLILTAVNVVAVAKPRKLHAPARPDAIAGAAGPNGAHALPPAVLFRHHARRAQDILFVLASAPFAVIIYNVCLNRAVAGCRRSTDIDAQGRERSDGCYCVGRGEDDVCGWREVWE